MPQIVEQIPDSLSAEAEAARAWFARQRGTEFKLTGIVDPDEIRQRGSTDDTHELQLILCGNENGQDVCLRERFEVSPSTDGFDIVHLEDSTPTIGSSAPLLDPPRGIRAKWLDTALSKHSFIVLVFYRGFW